MRRALLCLFAASLTLVCARADQDGPAATIVVFNKTGTQAVARPRKILRPATFHPANPGGRFDLLNR